MKYDEQKKLALRIFRGEKYQDLRKAIKKGKCFDELFLIAEEAGAIEHLKKNDRKEQKEEKKEKYQRKLQSKIVSLEIRIELLEQWVSDQINGKLYR